MNLYTIQTSDSETNTDKAANHLRTLVGDISEVNDSIVTRDDITSRLSDGTFYNYTPTVYRAGLAEPVKEGKRNVALRITDKGKQVLGIALGESPTIDTTPSSGAAKVALTLQEVTEVIETWNSQNKSWEIDPQPKYRKEVAR